MAILSAWLSPALKPQKPESFLIVIPFNTLFIEKETLLKILMFLYKKIQNLKNNKMIQSS